LFKQSQWFYLGVAAVGISYLATQYSLKSRSASLYLWKEEEGMNGCFTPTHIKAY
jgi:hypothetical protein